MKYGLIICGTVLLIVGVVLFLTGQQIITITVGTGPGAYDTIFVVPDPPQQALGAALGILGAVMLIVGMKTGES